MIYILQIINLDYMHLLKDFHNLIIHFGFLIYFDKIEHLQSKNFEIQAQIYFESALN